MSMAGHAARWADPPPLLAPAGGVVELAMLVREAMAAGASRHVLWLHLSRLPPRLRKPHHRRLVESALAPLRRQQRLRRFDLPNGDVAAIALPPSHALEGLRLSLGELFDEDDLGYLISTMKLPEEAAVVMAALEATLGFAQTRADEEDPAATPLSEEELVGLERILATADLSLFTRQQSICSLTAQDGGAALWAKDTTVMLREVLALLAPGRSVSDLPGLRRRLRHRLDDRMLTEMARPENARRTHPRSMALALPSLAAAPFLRLDAALPVVAKRAACLFVEAADILAQPGTFSAASQFLAARGYRLGLDISSSPQLQILSPRNLGAAAVRLPWAIAQSIEAELLFSLSTEHDVIVSGTDLPSAVAWGWQRGLALFQGQAIERRARRL